MESQRMNLSVVEESSTLVVQQQEQNENEKNVDDDNKIRPWVDLPSELLNLIFSSLFDPDHILFSSIRDQIRFRLTCKGWQSVGCLLGGQFPFLMSLKPTKGAPFTFFNPITNKEIQVFDDDEGNGIEYPELAFMSHIRCSRFGWWLMSRGCLLFFYNPFIPGSTIKLPLARIPLIQYIDSMSFTAPPTSKDCIVFAHDLYDPDNKKEVVIHRWCYGEDHWTDYHIDCQLPAFGQSSGNPIFYRSAFYQLNERGRLGISDPRKGSEQHIWKDLPRPKPLPYTKKRKRRKPSPYTKKRQRKQQPKAQEDDTIKIWTQHYMAECDGKLVMVVVEYKEFFLVHSVHIFELDWSRMEWVTVQSLGNKAIFISETGSLLIKTNGGGAENKIYFPVFVNTKDGDVVFVNTKEDGDFVFVNTKDGDDDGDATKKVGGFYCLENRTYNFPPVYWKRVLDCTWIDNKFQL